MDPVSALGVASSAVQFFSFIAKGLSRLSEIRKSADGFTDANGHARRRVKSFLKGLKDQSNELEKHKKALHTSQTGRRYYYAGIEGILASSIEAAKELENALEKLRPATNTRVGNLVAAIQSIWKERRLSELSARLNELRGDLMNEMVVVMFQTLQEDRLPIGKAEIEAEIRKTILQATATRSSHRKRLLSQQSHDVDIVAQEFADMREKACVQSLFFPILKDREDSISQAELNTFEWVFEYASEQQKSWSSFRKWLTGDENIYWINGKAGSGKSTLMKYIAGHATTKDLLDQWRHGRKLVIAKFFFGRTEVHSKELVPIVLSEALSLRDSGWPQFWTLRNLLRAWESLIMQRVAVVKICIFIDGLDEYEGNESEIARWFQGLAVHPNIKLCLSSRPHNAFEEAFHTMPKLKLQDLTLNDMRLYVGNQLNKSPYMNEFETHNRDFQQLLLTSIVGRADGVFLWVRLVTASLLEGIRNGDKPRYLLARLNELPNELEELFSHLLGLTKTAGGHGYTNEAFHQLSLVKYSQEIGKSLTLRDLYFAEIGPDDNNGDDPVFMRTEDFNKDFDDEMFDIECEKLRRRMQSRCMGLLEASETCAGWPAEWQVGFLHKTVADFLDKHSLRIQVDWPSDSILRRSLMRCTILDLKVLADPNRHEYVSREKWFLTVRPSICEFLRWAKAQEHRYEEDAIELLDELERTVGDVWSIVEVRTKSELKGQIHWAAAAVRPLTTTHPRNYELRCWDTAPFSQPLEYSSFLEFANAAGLEFYTEAKYVEAKLLEGNSDSVSKDNSKEEGEEDDSGYTRESASELGDGEDSISTFSGESDSEEGDGEEDSSGSVWGSGSAFEEGEEESSGSRDGDSEVEEREEGSDAAAIPPDFAPEAGQLQGRASEDGSLCTVQ